MGQIAFLLVSLSIFGRPGSAPPQTAEQAAVCDVARAGANYSGHSLMLTGTVAGRDPAHLLLTSSDCILGIKLAFSAESRTHEDVRVLFAAVKRNAAAGGGGGTDSGISGTFEGKFSYTQDAGGAVLAVDGIDRLNFPKQKH